MAAADAPNPIGDTVPHPSHPFAQSHPHHLHSEHVPQNKEEKEATGKALDALIDGHDETGGAASGQAPDHHALTPGVESTKNAHWWSRFFPNEERVHKLFAAYHLGNYVAIRGPPGQPPQLIWESMPIYVRLGMHLLFTGRAEEKFLTYRSVEHMLKDASERQGRAYDDESHPDQVLAHIRSFISTYQINCSELLEEDPKKYKNFNAFFSRQLKPDARPVAEPNNHRVISSAADCRLTVFENVTDATKFWVKGKHFTLPNLLDDASLAERTFPPGSSLAIFRLAPADYHRFHSPVGPIIGGPTKHIAGQYYTVNPQAVNEPFDVFTANRRDVKLVEWKADTAAQGGDDKPTHTVALVAIGAMLVGSIGWTAAQQGQEAQRGQEVGYFAYGGSTVVAVFPPQAKVQWDADLLENSRRSTETMVRVGERIGVAQA